MALLWGDQELNKLETIQYGLLEIVLQINNFSKYCFERVFAIVFEAISDFYKFKKVTRK